MLSLTQLNTFAVGETILQDARPANVFFSQSVPTNKVITITSQTVPVPSGTEIDEIANFETANVQLVISIKTSVVNPLTGSTITWPSLPTGVTVVQSPTGTYTVSGIKNVSDWNAVKNPTWNLPSNYTNFSVFYLETRVRYFDQQRGETVNVTNDIYDPIYYPLTFTATIATVSATPNATFQGRANLQGFSAILEDTQSINPGSAALTMTATLFLETFPIKGFEAELTSTSTSEVISIERLRRVSGAISAETSVSVPIVGFRQFFASSMQSEFGGFFTAGGVARLAIPSRTRPFAADLNVIGFTLTEGEDVRFMSANLSANTAVTVDAIKTARFISNQQSQTNVSSEFNRQRDNNININSNATIDALTDKVLIYSANINATSSLSCQIDQIAMEIEITYGVNVSTSPDIVLTFEGDTDIFIDWGDGTTTTRTTPGNISKSYSLISLPVTYKIRITGSATTLSSALLNQTFPHDPTDTTAHIRTFGEIGLTAIGSGFTTGLLANTSVQSVPTSLKTITDIRNFARNATNSDTNLANIVFWDTSAVTNMSGAFADSNISIIDISDWDTSNVTDMSGMFINCVNFNVNLSDWDTGNVTTMVSMFFGASNFNQPIGSWNTSNVTDMNSMFRNAVNFDQDISGWCVELIPTKPINFDTNTSVNWTTAEKPNWGAPC